MLSRLPSVGKSATLVISVGHSDRALSIMRPLLRMRSRDEQRQGARHQRATNHAIRANDMPWFLAEGPACRPEPAPMLHFLLTRVLAPIMPPLDIKVIRKNDA